MTTTNSGAASGSAPATTPVVIAPQSNNSSLVGSTVKESSNQEAAVEKVLASLAALTTVLEQVEAETQSTRAQSQDKISNTLIAAAKSKTADAVQQQQHIEHEQQVHKILGIFGDIFAAVLSVVAACTGQFELMAAIVVMTSLTASPALKDMTQAIAKDLEKDGVDPKLAQTLSSVISAVIVFVVSLAATGGASLAATAANAGESGASIGLMSAGNALNALGADGFGTNLVNEICADFPNSPINKTPWAKALIGELVGFVFSVLGAVASFKGVGSGLSMDKVFGKAADKVALWSSRAQTATLISQAVTQAGQAGNSVATGVSTLELSEDQAAAGLYQKLNAAVSAQAKKDKELMQKLLAELPNILRAAQSISGISAAGAKALAS